MRMAVPLLLLAAAVATRRVTAARPAIGPLPPRQSTLQRSLFGVHAAAAAAASPKATAEVRGPAGAHRTVARALREPTIPFSSLQNLLGYV